MKKDGVENKVHLLWFVRRAGEGEDTELLIGVYSPKRKREPEFSGLRARRDSSNSRKGSRFMLMN
jgi:hypothetical protein